jgi:RNA polymerase sigma-70 factor (ECF subfamily)
MSVEDTPSAPDSFEAHRPLLLAIAYRMLGSAMDAEDIVQEAYLRYRATAAGAIRSPRAFLSTVVTRLCLNQLASARAQREAYIGVWLPEPVLTGEGAAPDGLAPSPARHAELHESLSLAFLVLLEQLTPIERAVFLLREVFDYSYAEIAAIVEKDEAACRQVFSRAKKRITAGRPRFTATPEQHRALLSRFMRAVGDGQLDGLLRVLADDVTLWADGGGKARGAATRPLHGRMAVARFVLASTRYLPDDARAEIAEINGRPAALLRAGRRAVLMITVEADSDHVREIRVIGNPDKLSRV